MRPIRARQSPAKDRHFAQPVVEPLENPGNRAIWGFAEGEWQAIWGLSRMMLKIRV